MKFDDLGLDMAPKPTTNQTSTSTSIPTSTSTSTSTSIPTPISIITTPPEANVMKSNLTPVQRMFDGRSVFITGASGFIGRVLLEKLLRTYSGIQRIYILMRSKKNTLPKDRLHKQLLKVPIFDRIRSIDAEQNDENKKLLNKIVVITGDIGEPELGISEEDMRMMLEDKTLSIVFHSAATIKFDEPLKVSVKLNLIATKTIIEICRKLPNLISLCHVSTAYVNSDIKDQQLIEEKLYPMTESPDRLMQLANIMSEDLMQMLKLKFVDQRPNTYTYTKALAEHFIVEQASDLPVAIVRPSIVVAAWKEPLRGWIDNINGPTGLILAIGKGLLRTMQVSRSVKADVIPVDIVINTVIASAYYTAKINNKLEVPLADSIKDPLTSNNNNSIESTTTKTTTTTITTTTTEKLGEVTVRAESESESENRNSKIVPSFKLEKEVNLNRCFDSVNKKSKVATNGTTATNEVSSKKETPIIHCNSGHLRPITWGEMEDLFFPIIRNYPSAQVFRYPFGSFKGNKYHDLLARIFAHYLPALIIDMLCVMMGKKRQLLSIYNKLHSATGALAHFCVQNYNYQTNNIKFIKDSLEDERDRRDLYMDIENLDWYNFWDDYVLGARRFVLKEDDETLPEARKSFQRAYLIEIGLRALLIVLLSLACLPLILRFNASFPLRNVMMTLSPY